MRLATVLTLPSMLVLGACTVQTYTPPSYVSTNHYSNPVEDFRQSNIVEAQREAKAAREAITSGAKARLTIAEGENSVRQELRDPESARFHDVQRNTVTGAVCGFVNAKNAYGGYVGEMPFIYYHSSKHQSPQVLMSSSISASVTLPYIAAFCPADGTTVSADAPSAAPRTHHRS